MARPVWSGTISFGLVNVPVKAFTAVRDHDVHFHQLDKRSGARIRYKKVSEKSGREIDDERHRDGLRDRRRVATSRSTRTSSPSCARGRPRRSTSPTSSPLDEVDPIYYERTYWLAPDGDAAERAYQLLLAAMEDRDQVAIGTVVMRNKQYLTAIRPLDGVLAMSTMRFADEVVPRARDRGTAVIGGRSRRQELKMAMQLIDSLASDWDPKQYKDTYVEELRDRIEAKEAGKEIVAEEPAERAADVIDLSEALQRSLDEARGAKRKRTYAHQVTQERLKVAPATIAHPSADVSDRAPAREPSVAACVAGERNGRTLGLVSASISVRGVTKFFGRLEALRLIDLDVAPGEIVTVLGASGSGKTTLLRLMGGLDEPSSGVVEVDGGSPHAARIAKRVGFVPQSPALLPWRTVARNASLLLEVNRDATSEAARSPTDLLTEVGLADFAGAYPHELSGGMRQRVLPRPGDGPRRAIAADGRAVRLAR